MYKIIENKDLLALSKLTPEQRSTPGPNNRTVLHHVANNHDIDFLLACICIGCNQKIRDDSGKLFSDYLEQWEYDYIKQRFEAWRIGKAWVNTYQASFDSYLSYGFSLSGKPMLSLIWDNKLGVETLEQVLEAGVDLDHPHIRAAAPPQEYKEVMARYGWVPTVNTESVAAEINTYYPPELWSESTRDAQITVSPIGRAPIGVVGKTVVCISDTHWEHRRLHIPGGEFLICSGDLCMPWHKDLTGFLLWMGSQTHTYKILVAGNHDKILQNNKEKYLQICKEQDIIYLEDSGVEIEGIKFWGSPWTPKRPRNKNNAFTLPRRELMNKWNLIPDDTNVLITHCPPYAIGDCNTDFYKGPPYQGGDYGLRKTINRLTQLKIHAFGHQHFGRGMYKSDTGVYFANSAIANNAAAYVFA